MLRITVGDSAGILTFRLEGRLEGPWVSELEQCWRSMWDGVETVEVDFMGVTYIDAAAKALLAEMHEHGARFLAGDCEMKAVVAEIVGDE